MLDGASRALIHWDLRESMNELEVECILERAGELYPGARPRIISDNGPQFVAKDFKEFVRLSGMTHVRISPYYPQSNGRIERWHQTMKGDVLRPAQPATLAGARRVITRFVGHDNRVRLHSALGYGAPLAFMVGQAPAIWAERDRKLEAAREQRRQAAASAPSVTPDAPAPSGTITAATGTVRVLRCITSTAVIFTLNQDRGGMAGPMARDSA